MSTNSYRVICGASTISVFVTLPVFLVGSLAIVIRSELEFDYAALGISVSVFFLASAAVSFLGGHLSDRLGARHVFHLAALITLTSLVGITTLAQGWLGLSIFLAVAGAASGLAQPAANLMLVQHVSSSHQGFAFGVMKAAAPFALLLAGLAVPIFGVAAGWRWAFAAAGTLILVLPFVSPPLCPPTGSPRLRNMRRHRTFDGPMALLACAIACAAAAGTVMGAFFVDSAVRDGLSLHLAGALLAVGSTVGIGTRLLVGWLVDRLDRDPFIWASLLLLVGAVGLAGINLASRPVVIGLMAVLAFGPGWSWPGLLNLAVVRRYRQRPGSAIGAMQTGGHLGAVVGPVIFVAIVNLQSFVFAWNIVASLPIVAGVLVLIARKILIARAGENVRFSPR